MVRTELKLHEELESKPFCKGERQWAEGHSEMTHMLELSDEDIKTAIITKQRNWKVFQVATSLFSFLLNLLVNKIV